MEDGKNKYITRSEDFLLILLTLDGHTTIGVLRTKPAKRWQRPERAWVEGSERRWYRRQYVHLDGERVAEGTEALAEMIFGEFLPNCDLTVTQQSNMVS